MATYLLSVFTPAEPGPYGPYATKEEMLASFEATGEFNEMLEREGHFVFADGLQPPQAATWVDGRGGTPAVTDGPYLESKEYLGGFWVIRARDLQQALALAEQGSRACGGVVEVRPFHTEESLTAQLGD